MGISIQKRLVKSSYRFHEHLLTNARKYMAKEELL